MVDLQSSCSFPSAASVFSEALRWVWRRSRARGLLRDLRTLDRARRRRAGSRRTASNEEALKRLLAASNASGFTRTEIALWLDVARPEVLRIRSLRFRPLRAQLLEAEFFRLPRRSLQPLPDRPIEDGWPRTRDGVGDAHPPARQRGQLVGDDSFVTNSGRLRTRSRRRGRHSILSMSIRSIVDGDARHDGARGPGCAYTCACRTAAVRPRYATMPTLRSRDDLRHIKAGAPARSDRVAKSPLLRIEPTWRVRQVVTSVPGPSEERRRMTRGARARLRTPVRARLVAILFRRRVPTAARISRAASGQCLGRAHEY